MDFIPADWPWLARATVGILTGGTGTALVLATLYLVIRYLVVAPPAPLERLYARLRRAPAHQAAHAWTGLYARVQGRQNPDTDLMPVVGGWHERSGQT